MAPMTTNDNEIGRPLAPPPETLLSRLFEPLGQRVISLVNNLGAAAIFLIKALVLIFGRKQFRAIVQQINIIGAKTVNIVALVGFFTGMVMGLQLYYTLVKYGSTGVLGSAVALSIIRELGPVLTEGFQAFLGQTNAVQWGKKAYGPGENGGSSDSFCMR